MLVKNLKKGEFFKRKCSSSIVYVRGEYIREVKKYECYDYYDINKFIYLPGVKVVCVNFDF